MSDIKWWLEDHLHLAWLLYAVIVVLLFLAYLFSGVEVAILGTFGATTKQLVVAFRIIWGLIFLPINIWIVRRKRQHSGDIMLSVVFLFWPLVIDNKYSDYDKFQDRWNEMDRLRKRIEGQPDYQEAIRILEADRASRGITSPTIDELIEKIKKEENGNIHN